MTEKVADLMADARLNPLTRDAYRWLRLLANDEIDAANGAFRDDWARIERELAAGKVVANALA